MTALEQLRLLRKLAQEKADFIDEAILKLLDTLDRISPKLADLISKEILNNLDIRDGIVTTTLNNQNKIASIEKLIKDFMAKEGVKVISTMANDLMKISSLNEKYFTKLQGEKIDGTKIEKIILNRLGMDDEGNLKRNGFMKGLFDFEQPKRDIINFAMEKTTNGTGFEDLRSGLKELIVGNENKMGKFKQFYRNAAYDTYVKIDAANGKLYADKLSLNYFIYAGSRRKTSRHFCIERKGKVFSREETDTWKDLIGTTTVDDKGKVVPAGPILVAEDAATYNPFIDRGGYACVDDIMWVGDEVAFSMRPELRNLNNKK